MMILRHCDLPVEPRGSQGVPMTSLPYSRSRRTAVIRSGRAGGLAGELSIGGFIILDGIQRCCGIGGWSTSLRPCRLIPSILKGQGLFHFSQSVASQTRGQKGLFLASIHCAVQRISMVKECRPAFRMTPRAWGSPQTFQAGLETRRCRTEGS